MIRCGLYGRVGGRADESSGNSTGFCLLGQVVELRSPNSFLRLILLLTRAYRFTGSLVRNGIHLNCVLRLGGILVVAGLSCEKGEN
jgi:hypothetical protein